MNDSGSVVSLITKTMSNRILRTTLSAKWITIKQDKDPKTFSKEPIKVLEKLATTLTYNDWTCKVACSTAVEDGHKLIIERFNSLGLALIQQQAKSGKFVNNIDKSTFIIKDAIASQFPRLVLRIGL